MPYDVGKMDSVIGNSINANNTTQTKRYILHTTNGFESIVVTYPQFDSNIRVLYVFLGFLKNTAQNTQSGKGYAKNHCDRSRSGRIGSLITAPGLGKADFCFQGLRVKPAGTRT
jgi:hypothetical protein